LRVIQVTASLRQIRVHLDNLQSWMPVCMSQDSRAIKGIRTLIAEDINSARLLYLRKS